MMPAFADQVRGWAAALRALWRRNATAREIAGLDRQEASCIARDLGLTPAELRALAAQDVHAADLLLRRMSTIGLAPKTVDAAVMHDLQRCCSMCRDKPLCVYELEDRPRQAVWPKYCPNETTLTALTGDRPPPAEPSPAPHRKPAGEGRPLLF